LSEGNVDIIAVATDAHQMHIMEHKTVLASPEARMDSLIVNATLAHIQEHINLLSSTDPNLLRLIGQEELAPQPGQGTPPMAGGQVNPADVMSAENPVIQQAAGVSLPNMPEMPENALTGMEYTPETGGLPQG